MLDNGFNHDAAERPEATELVPVGAMCWWGAALVLGPHVNSGMDPPTMRSLGAPQTAVALAPKSTERELFPSRALSARYADPPQDRRRNAQRRRPASMSRTASPYAAHPDHEPSCTCVRGRWVRRIRSVAWRPQTPPMAWQGRRRDRPRQSLTGTVQDRHALATGLHRALARRSRSVRHTGPADDRRSSASSAREPPPVPRRQRRPEELRQPVRPGPRGRAAASSPQEHPNVNSPRTPPRSSGSPCATSPASATFRSSWPGTASGRWS